MVEISNGKSKTGSASPEEFIGEWMEKRQIRDQLVIATKVRIMTSDYLNYQIIAYWQYTTNYKQGNTSIRQHVNYVGNNAKSMHISVAASLKKLRTDYIDLLYLHWWDFDTSVEEVMVSLHNLAVSGKVIYLVGISFNF